MKNKSKKKIFIREKFTDFDDSNSILWTGYLESKNQKSILKYIRENSRELRSSYLSWIHSLGKVKVGKNCLEEYLKIDSDFSFMVDDPFHRKEQYQNKITLFFNKISCPYKSLR